MEPLFNFTGCTMLSVAAFLATAAMLAEVGIALVILLRRGSWLAARWVATGGAVIAGTYLTVLAGVSLAGGGRSPAPRLDEPSPVARLLIGHEHSLLLAPAPVRLDDANSFAGSKP